MSSYVIRKTPGDTAWFTARPLRYVYPLGPVRHARPPRMGQDQRDASRRKNTTSTSSTLIPTCTTRGNGRRQAKAAGMKYAVLTTKHHEGFCMWDTQYTDYKCTNTPAGRDLVREYVDAFRAEGLRVGFYYSLIDWHHPDFPIDMLHPRRDDPRRL